MIYKILYLPTGYYLKDDTMLGGKYVATTVAIIVNRENLKSFLGDLFNNVTNHFDSWCKCNDINVNIIPEHIIIHKVSSKGVIINENYIPTK